MSDLPFQDVIAQLQREGKLPNRLTALQVAAIERSLRNYADNVGTSITQTQLDAIKQAMIKAVQSLANPVQIDGVTSGLNPGTARNSIAAVLQELSIPGLMAANNIDFALQVARGVVMGAASYVRDTDPAVVDEYPAWELLRVYPRDVPRGFRRGAKGVLMPDPDQDWPSRWLAAGGSLSDGGRMIALKGDDVWQNLGDGVGGYDDTLGNAFPPFAFNSGFDVRNIGRAECNELGLLDKDEPATPPRFDLAKLFASFA